MILKQKSPRRLLPLLLIAVMLLTIAATAASEPRQVIALSTDAAGAGADDMSTDPNISGDGRRVVFRSIASNLVPGDANGQEDIFLKNADTNGINRISVSAAGAEADGESRDPAMTPDGKFIVFSTRASNLAPGTSGNVLNVVRKEMATGVVLLASADATGAEGNASSVDPVISADGRYIAFASGASNLAPGDNNALLDVYLKDMASGAVIRVSAGPGGEDANGASGDLFGPSITADGQMVAFSSQASNLAPADTDAVHDILLKNMESGEIVVVSTSDSEVKGNGNSLAPAISASGDAVVFRSSSTNMSAADTEPEPDIYHKSLRTGKLTLVSADAAGVKANQPSYEPAISPDGEQAAFSSPATNIVPGTVEPRYHVYLKNMGDGAVTLVSADAAGAPGNGHSTTPSIAKAPNRVAFESTSTNLAPRTPGDFFKVFLAVSAGPEPSAGCA